MLPKKFRLPIQQWMKKRGRKIITKKSNFFIVKFMSNGLGYSRFGIIISSKIQKKAVERNRLKREIFNFIRLNNFHLRPGKDFLVVALPAVAGGIKREILKKELNL
jgi:ribonuclease P protein component